MAAHVRQCSVGRKAVRREEGVAVLPLERHDDVVVEDGRLERALGL